jgi:hypothetical protein
MFDATSQDREARRAQVIVDAPSRCETPSGNENVPHLEGASTITEHRAESALTP